MDVFEWMEDNIYKEITCTWLVQATGTIVIIMTAAKKISHAVVLTAVTTMMTSEVVEHEYIRTIAQFFFKFQKSAKNKHI